MFLVLLVGLSLCLSGCPSDLLETLCVCFGPINTRLNLRADPDYNPNTRSGLRFRSHGFVSSTFVLPVWMTTI